ncbi:MAG TPA: response regulator [Candidatus Caenarcaniphilales bacterium]
MNETNTLDNRGTIQQVDSLSLLAQLSNQQTNGRLQVSSGSVFWSIYLEQGKLVYATHSVEPIDRIDRHLRRLSHQTATFTTEVRTQVRLLFETEQNQGNHNSDYQAICWLVQQHYLSPVQAIALIEELAKEIIESLLLVTEGTYELFDGPNELTQFCRLQLQPLVEHCQKRLKEWQSLGPQIWSPYQRPYFFGQKSGTQSQLLPQLQQKLGSILKGFSFRQLAALLNQDELRLAQTIRPYIVDGIVFLREPQPPYDQLPKISTRALEIAAQPIGPPSPVLGNVAPLAGLPVPPVGKKTFSIACVDDSPTILHEIKRFLDDNSFSVSTINDPVKALMQIVRIKPDLILLDVGMPAIDGYELCRLLRNHSLFKTTPIVMVTGNTGIVDRARARLVGASGYLTKPFTQSDLLKMVFRHLT